MNTWTCQPTALRGVPSLRAARNVVVPHDCGVTKLTRTPTTPSAPSARALARRCPARRPRPRGRRPHRRQRVERTGVVGAVRRRVDDHRPLVPSRCLQLAVRRDRRIRRHASPMRRRNEAPIEDVHVAVARVGRHSIDGRCVPAECGTAVMASMRLDACPSIQVLQFRLRPRPHQCLEAFKLRATRRD